MLPVKARMKFTRIVEAAQDAQDQVGSIMRRLSDAQKAIGVSSASAQATISQEVERLREKLAIAQQRHRAYADLNAKLIYFQQTLGNVTVEDVRAKPPKVAKGESLSQTVTRIRLKLDGLKAERSKIETAGLPIEDLKKQAAEYVAELAELGRPRLIAGHGHKLSASFTALVEGAYAPKLNIGAALAWLDASAFLKRLIGELEAQPKPALALSLKDKAERLAALDVEILTLEFEEEACVEASEVEGPVLQRRPEASPLAVLGVVIRTTPATAKLERVRT